MTLQHVRAYRLPLGTGLSPQSRCPRPGEGRSEEASPSAELAALRFKRPRCRLPGPRARCAIKAPCAVADRADDDTDQTLSGTP